MNKTVEQPFPKRDIRTVRTVDGLVRISLDDLCGILGCGPDKSRAMPELFPTALRVSFQKGGRQLWSIRPEDMRLLLRPLRRGNTIPRDLLDGLEAWGNRLFERECGETECEGIQTFLYRDDFPVSFRRLDGRLMANATQITMRFGKLPSMWLRISSTKELRREMARKGQTGSYEAQVFTTRGRGHGATWVEAPLLLPLIRWLDSEGGLPEWCAARIRELDGSRMYHPHKTANRQAPSGCPYLDKPVPENPAEMAAMIRDLREALAESLPKIEFYEEFIENRDWFKSTRLADELGISPHRLHRFLMKEKICEYEKRQWVALPSYRYLQCDVPYVWTNARGKAYTFGTVKRWTQQGREFILDLWHKRNP